MKPWLVDVNVILAAHRDDHPAHQAVKPWFDRLLTNDIPFTVPSLVWASFLRLATHFRIFVTPTTIGEAFAFIDALTSQPHHLRLEPGPRHLSLLRNLCDEGGASGDLVPDAILGSLAVEHGCVVATMDRDFARFPSVEHELIRA
jgi:uncharacterized protein